jgi:hypothetical protein
VKQEKHKQKHDIHKTRIQQDFIAKTIQEQNNAMILKNTKN